MDKIYESKISLKWGMEAPGIDPGTSRMLSERSTIWATPPDLYPWQGQHYLPFPLWQYTYTQRMVGRSILYSTLVHVVQMYDNKVDYF